MKNGRYITFQHKTRYEIISIGFDKKEKSVNVHHIHFILNDPTLERQWEREKDERAKQSCKYGHWQSETVICLSAEDIKFINKRYKKLFGEPENEWD